MLRVWYTLYISAFVMRVCRCLDFQLWLCDNKDTFSLDRSVLLFNASWRQYISKDLRKNFLRSLILGCVVPFWQPDEQEMPHQNYTTNLKQAELVKFTQTFRPPTSLFSPPLSFTVKKFEFLHWFSTPVTFDALWFENGGTYRTTNYATVCDDDWSFFTLFFPNFTDGQMCRNVGEKLSDFETLQFRTKPRTCNCEL